MTPENRRQAPRIQTELIVELYETEGRFVVGVGRLRDISTSGFLFEGNLKVKPGDTLRTRVRLKRDLVLEAPVRVAWSQAKGTRFAYGMEFKGMSQGDHVRMEQWVKEHTALS